MIKVLCVDGDPGRLGELGDFLQGTGDMSVRTSTSPIEALEMARRERFDAIISEYELGEMTGLRFLAALREIDREVVFVLFTSEESKEVVIEATLSDSTLFVCRGRDVIDRRSILAARLRHALKMREEEAAHREKEELLTSILSAAPDVIFALDREMRIIEVYRSELDPGSARGKSFLDFTNPEYHEVIRQAIGRLFETGEPVRWEARGGQEFDGDIWYDSHASLLRDGGRVVGAVVVSRDISNRKAMESELKESEAKFHSLFVNALDAMFLTRPDGSILMANPTACEMLGMSEEELVAGGRDSILVRDELLERALEERRRTGMVKCDLHFRRKDGVILIGETASNVFRAADGSHMTSIVIRNVTERKQREDALRLANLQLNLLNQVTRHDMINQITIMSGYVTLLETGDLNDSHRQFVRKVKNSLEMLRSQLEFTRQYQEIGTEPPRWQSVAELVRKAMGSLELNGLRVIGPDADLCVKADPMLEKVVYNLIENVVRHGKGASKVVITAQEEDGQTVLAFQDDGSGIDDADREHLFERGYGKHTGFGLFMSREILRMTGLEIRENSVPGSGARFEIVVPEAMCRRSRIDLPMTR
jgi:PAS domain S-box-containing protein